MANTWNKSGTTWGYNSWESDTVTGALTAPSTLTSSIGSLEAYNEQGYGRDPWGYENWGESAHTVTPTGQSLTTSINDVNITPWQEVDLGVNNTWQDAA